eukprot:TRINITY_DN7488_c0_g1_i1.p1 TRINITY_DN7488_c0_g1~~TRINITY_DN7488_c0_g1_i1.p1  ORF type:complete len:1144 (+),score=265.61 TRINITY_DN7488_c0_g1_i1:74-3433(+)
MILSTVLSLAALSVCGDWEAGWCSSGGTSKELGRGVSFSNCVWLCKDTIGGDKCCAYNSKELVCTASEGGIAVPDTGVPSGQKSVQCRKDAIQPQPPTPVNVFHLTTSTIGAFILDHTVMQTLVPVVEVQLIMPPSGVFSCDGNATITSSSPATSTYTLRVDEETTAICSFGVNVTRVASGFRLTTPAPYYTGDAVVLQVPSFDYLRFGLSYTVAIDGREVASNMTNDTTALPVLGPGLHVVAVFLSKQASVLWGSSLPITVLPRVGLDSLLEAAQRSGWALQRLKIYHEAKSLLKTEDDLRKLLAGLDTTIGLIADSNYPEQSLLLSLIEEISGSLPAPPGFSFTGTNLRLAERHDTHIVFIITAAQIPASQAPAGHTLAHIRQLTPGAVRLPYWVIPEDMMYPSPCKLRWTEYLEDIGVWAEAAGGAIEDIKYPESVVLRNKHVQTDYTEAQVRCVGGQAISRRGAVLGEDEDEEIEVQTKTVEGWYGATRAEDSVLTSWGELDTHRAPDESSTTPNTGTVLVVILTLGLVYMLLGVGSVLYDLLKDKKLTERYELLGESEKSAIATRRAAMSSNLTCLHTHSHTHNTSLNTVPDNASFTASLFRSSHVRRVTSDSSSCPLCTQAAASVSRIAVDVESHDDMSVPSRCLGTAATTAATHVLGPQRSMVASFIENHMFTTIFKRVTGGTKSTGSRLTVLFAMLFCVSLLLLLVFGKNGEPGAHTVILGSVCALAAFPVPLLVLGLLTDVPDDGTPTKLYVRVIETTKIATDTIKLPDAYPTLQLGASSWRGNPCWEDATPNWGPAEEAYLVPRMSGRHVLEVGIMHSDVRLGEANIDVSELLEGDRDSVTGWYDLTEVSIPSPKAYSRRKPEERPAVRLVMERRGKPLVQNNIMPDYITTPATLVLGLVACVLVEGSLAPCSFGVEAALLGALVLCAPFYYWFSPVHEYVYSQFGSLAMFIICAGEYNLTFLWSAVGLALFSSAGLGAVVLYKDNMVAKQHALIGYTVLWCGYLLVMGICQSELQRVGSASLSRCEVLAYPGLVLAFSISKLGYPTYTSKPLAVVITCSFLFASLGLALSFATEWPETTHEDYLVAYATATGLYLLVVEPLRVLLQQE